MPHGLQEILGESGFRHMVATQERSSIADLFGPRSRCGIYVLVFENRDIYVGQAKDVTRRYVQHRQTWPDIAMLAFKRVRKTQLDEAERELISSYEVRGLPLRNIALTSMPPGESDIDLVIPRAEQDAWLVGKHAYEIGVADRVDLSRLAAKTAHRAKKFMQARPPTALATFLRAYAKEVLPDPARTEMDFWCVTLRSGCMKREWGIISRVNVNWQEVMTLLWDSGKLWVKFQAAKSTIEGSDGLGLSRLTASYPWLTWDESRYVAGGADQIMLYAPIQQATRLLRDVAVRQALRLQIIRLMRKGRCMYPQFHCPQIADLMFESPEQDAAMA